MSKREDTSKVMNHVASRIAMTLHELNRIMRFGMHSHLATRRCLRCIHVLRYAFNARPRKRARSEQESNFGGSRLRTSCVRSLTLLMPPPVPVALAQGGHPPLCDPPGAGDESPRPLSFIQVMFGSRFAKKLAHVFGSSKRTCAPGGFSLGKQTVDARTNKSFGILVAVASCKHAAPPRNNRLLTSLKPNAPLTTRGERSPLLRLWARRSIRRLTLMIVF